MHTSKIIDELIHFYEHLTADSVAHFPEYYAQNAYFKDPFNEVHGLAPIQRIFTHLFAQVAEPRFVVLERIVDEHAAMIVWELHYRAGRWAGGEEQIMRGVSHLKFDADGKITWHRDYWDTAEELYTKLPVIGCLMRGLRNALTT